MRFRKYPFFFAIFLICLIFSSPAQDGSGISEPAAPAQAESPASVPGPSGIGEDGAEEGAALADTAIENTGGEPEGIAGESSTLINFVKKLGIALAVVAGQILFIWLVWQLFKWIDKKAIAYGGQKIKPLTIKKFRILTTRQIISVIHFVLRIVKYIVTIFLFFITIPIVFSLFPQTENVASTLFGYILTPLKKIVIDTVKYIPNLITIIIILVVAKYALRALKFFAIQIEREKLVIPGFYADWAQPTFNILRVLLYAFTVAVIYPYLPGSGSPIFQGVSVFVGIIFSLGSSSAIGNLIAGLVITYMRPFKIGDRIQLKDITGFVVEKSPIVTRIKTHKNEYVTFPNQMVLTSSIINYNTSSDEDEEGLILYTEITMGYNIPWPKVHEILIAAARKTANVLSKPKPYVLQTALNDYAALYQINLFTKEVNKTPAIYSELHQNIQNGFNEAGIDLTSPSYQIRINGDEIKPPREQQE
jgi:small-conductance mechanosensitive channel